MSVSSVGSGSLPDPAFYTYPTTTSLPTGLADGSAPAPTSSTTASSGAAATGATSKGVSDYENEYEQFEQYDMSELIQVSLGSASSAASNVDSVLAQAAALQQQEEAAQNAAAASGANADIQGTSSNPTSADATDPLDDLPSYQSIITQSDDDAYNALNSSLGTGSSGLSTPYGGNIDTTA